MKKDYTSWHSKKSGVNDIVKRPFFHEREIWYCSIGVNVGFEQDGGGEDFLRPVIILRKFNNEIFWAIPLTRSNKIRKTKAERFYHSFTFVPEFTSVAILSQIRLIDSKRLTYQIGDMPEIDFIKLKEKLKALIP